MAIIFCIVICIIYALIALKKEKKIINPLTIFCILWAIIIWLSSLELYGLYSTSETIYWKIFFGILSFGIGYFICRLLFKRYSFRFCYGDIILGSDYRKTYIPRYRLLKIIGLICCIYYFIEFLSIAKYLFSDNAMEIIRNLASDSTSTMRSDKSALENAINALFFGPLSMAIPAIAAVDFWFGRKNKKLFFIACGITALRIITDGGRAILMYFLLHFITAYLFSNSRNKIGKKLIISSKKIIIFIVILVVGIIMYQVTISRSGIKPLRTAYFYFAMQPFMFETWADEVNRLGITGYGFASTNGFWFALFYSIKNLLGLSNYPEFWNSINMLIAQTDDVWKMISSEVISANAYVSLFWFLYLDGREIGIILGMFIYGLVSGQTFSNAIKYLSPRSVCIYSFILQGLVFSFIRLQFSNIFYTIAFIFIMFIAYRPIVNTEVES